MRKPAKLTTLGFAIFAGLLVITLALSAAPATAQDDEPTDDEVNAIAKGLYCPVCENVPLDVCPTQACIQWRATIREKLAQGWTEDQIRAYFVEQYGDRVLDAPPLQGLNWLVYILPLLAFLGGAIILVRAVRGWRPAGEPMGASEGEAPLETPEHLDPYMQRLEEELRRRA